MLFDHTYKILCNLHIVLALIHIIFELESDFQCKQCHNFANFLDILVWWFPSEIFVCGNPIRFGYETSFRMNFFHNFSVSI